MLGGVEIVTAGRQLGVSREGEHGARWQETTQDANSKAHGWIKKSQNLRTDRKPQLLGVLSAQMLVEHVHNWSKLGNRIWRRSEGLFLHLTAQVQNHFCAQLKL